MIDSEGHCAIADFGMARVADNQELQMAARYAPGGTPDYFAPELITCPTSNNMMVYWDHGVDYWALGATIFYLQTGKVCIVKNRINLQQSYRARAETSRLPRFWMEPGA